MLMFSIAAGSSWRSVVLSLCDTQDVMIPWQRPSVQDPLPDGAAGGDQVVQLVVPWR